MEDKEKQIEEIRHTVENYFEDRLIIGSNDLARKLYKIAVPEDSVVLSREEYIKNLQTHYYMGQREVEEEYKTIQIPKERKEIAEKAFEITKKIIDKKYAIETPWTRATLSNIIDQIEEEFAKQFGVEV